MSAHYRNHGCPWPTHRAKQRAQRRQRNAIGRANPRPEGRRIWATAESKSTVADTGERRPE
ncbi:hypothetical protein [Gordonia alkanivorans]|uniref:hypothetical protein n=1 Tax=Gordonia alkanivorans TaxID=84096 RepID=UPI0024498065|nr:hypothetical protein [Gordonia alkanivorans]MDH3007091.1 hypothetical protein [Gordonia alkanivorans]MDH3015035.1 hypothetical protein [Gordonia alkanivorans]MDH3021622.1 hypothetical protein [Gordonia alkanivorans]MDH3040155.1 hypothetical protein [Gordonia alkanivorans]MDH3059413.1 hypothetical protein [Gordonia alkanivorans]